MAWELGDYCTLEEARAEVGIKAANTDHDSLLEEYIENSSREIDEYCGRHFYGLEETRYFDPEEDLSEDGRDLLLDEDLAAVISVTIGGTTLPADEFVTRPANVTPSWGLRMLQSSSMSWYDYTDDSENSIAVAGSWGYNPGTTPPAVIRRACVALVRWKFQRKKAAPEGGAGGDKGAFNVSSDIPAEIQRNLRTFVRWRPGATK